MMRKISAQLEREEYDVALLERVTEVCHFARDDCRVCKIARLIRSSCAKISRICTKRRESIEAVIDRQRELRDRTADIDSAASDIQDLEQAGGDRRTASRATGASELFVEFTERPVQLGSTG